eukprot:1139547-Pelagomonas_calceolata.AAC.9
MDLASSVLPVPAGEHGHPRDSSEVEGTQCEMDARWAASGIRCNSEHCSAFLKGLGPVANGLFSRVLQANFPAATPISCWAAPLCGSPLRMVCTKGDCSTARYAVLQAQGKHSGARPPRGCASRPSSTPTNLGIRACSSSTEPGTLTSAVLASLPQLVLHHMQQAGQQEQKQEQGKHCTTCTALASCWFSLAGAAAGGETTAAGAGAGLSWAAGPPQAASWAPLCCCLPRPPRDPPIPK